MAMIMSIMRMKKEGSPVKASSLILLIVSVAAGAFLIKYHTPECYSVLLKDQSLKGQADHPSCQLLPEVPDDLSWIKVPMDERGDQCSSHAKGINLKRCCVGQCRKSDTKISSYQPEYEGLFLKPDMPVLDGSAQNMLEYLHYFVQQQNLERIKNDFSMNWVERMNNKHLGGRAPQIDTCVLWFVGQSLTQDQASAAICKLTSLGYEIPNKKKCDINDEDGLLEDTCELATRSSQYCPKIRVRFTWDHARWQRSRHAYLDEAGPIIYNYGVHANSLEAFDEWMEKKFTIDDFQAIDQVGRYPFMWREHEPQHFATEDGTWGGQASQCQDSSVYNNYRNEAAIRFFEKNGLLGKISVIKSFNALRPLSGFHLGFGDCTHYCYSPWRFDLTWHGIAKGLQTLPEQHNACMESHSVDAQVQAYHPPPPCQLLPQVPDDLSWIKVPMDERGDQCSSHAKGINLKRCCVGQCRKSDTKISSDQPEYEGLFLKPDMPVLDGSAQNMLEYLHYFVQQQNLERIKNDFRMTRVERMNNKHLGGRAPPIDTCVLWFVGQSLTQDQASAAICKLTSLGYEIPDKKKCDINDEDGLLEDTCELTTRSSQYCPKIRVRYVWDHARWQRSRHKYLDEAGPIIYNYGVHANSLEAFDEWMEKKFTIDDFQAIDQVGRYPFMWREHEPQHFATKDGTWGGQASQCQDSGVYNNYRNEAAIRFFEKNGLLGKISVIKSFNAQRPLSGFHLGFGDCTHYCYSPWRFDLTWHGIAMGLQTLPEQQNACMESHSVDAQFPIQIENKS